MTFRGRGTSKRAATVMADVALTTHGARPEQAPTQPANSDPAPGVGVSVTYVPAGKLAAQAVPQWMPGGSLSTSPEADPIFDTAMVAAPSEAAGVPLAIISAFDPS